MPRRKTRDKDGIYRRKDSPFWWACYPLGRGGSARRSTGVSIAEDPEGLKAHAVRSGWRTQHQAAETGEGATFDDLMLAYLHQVTPAKRAPERDKYSAKALFRVLTARKLDDIGAADVRGYIASRSRDGVSPATINREIGLMSAALNWANRELEWDAPNPWGSRRLREPPGRSRWLTDAEASALLKAAAGRQARSPWLEDFIRLCLYCGLRPGEALELTWGRVDLGRNLIRFGAADQKSGKLGSIPVNRNAREALLERARYRASYCPGSQWVFCRRDGSRVAAIKRSFSGAVKEAGLVDVHPHDLRRTFGSWLVQAGVGIERVSELLRHADVAITARVYAHLRPSDLAEATAVLDQPGNTFSRAFSRDGEDDHEDARPILASD